MDWSLISHQQFEDIALRYVRDVHQEFSWIATKATRDGNKDGVAHNTIESMNLLHKYWYEAKYTENPSKSIPKSHMDSTLVSGIIDGQVRYILFITNGRITSEFKLRARDIECKFSIKIGFVEGDILEHWLENNRDILSVFFDVTSDTEYGRKDDFLIIEDIFFFDSVITPISLISPVRKLIKGEEYQLYISVRTSLDTSIRLDIGTDCLSPIHGDQHRVREFRIQPGFSSFFVKFIASISHKGSINITLSSICGINESKTFNLVIENNPEPRIVYSRQSAIIHEIYNYSTFQSMPATLLSIKGKEGTGKSTLLNKLILNLAERDNDVLVVSMSDKKSESALMLCRLILFLNFGSLYTFSREAFLENIKNKVNLPYETYLSLLDGTENQLVAESIIGKLSSQLLTADFSLLTFSINRMRKNISYIVIDDFQKTPSDFSLLCQSLLREIQGGALGQMIVIGCRPDEFKNPTLESCLDDIKDREWVLDSITSEDIGQSISNNLGDEISKVARFFQHPISILHLNLLVKKLIEKSISHLSAKQQVACFEVCYRETNIQNGPFAKSKIKNCPHLDVLYVVYMIETGVPEWLLANFFGESFWDALKILAASTLVKSENQIVKPFHDVYLYAFKDIKFKAVHMKPLEDFLVFCMNTKLENSSLESNILATYINSTNYRSEVTVAAMRDSCWKYYNASQYTASMQLSKALLPDLDDTPLNCFSALDIEMLFVYAQSVKWSLSHIDSDKFLKMLCDVDEVVFLDSTSKGYVYEAYTELLNNAIWAMDDKTTAKYIVYLDSVFKTGITENETENKVIAYLNLANRKMLNSALFGDSIDLESLFEFAISESSRIGRYEFVGYALMDHAKNILHLDLQRANTLLKEAYVLFCKGDSFLKRKYDCLSEVIFSDAILYNKSFDKLYQLQNITLSAGLYHVYTKISLKILALEIVHRMDITSVESRLKKLSLQYPDIHNQNRLAIKADLLWAAIYHTKGNQSLKKKHLSDYLALGKNLNSSYKDIAKHNNKRMHHCNIGWASLSISDASDCFLLDPRIW